ncbi:hypothetical protein [Streptomyces sp. NPDC002402]
MSPAPAVIRPYTVFLDGSTGCPVAAEPAGSVTAEDLHQARLVDCMDVITVHAIGRTSAMQAAAVVDLDTPADDGSWAVLLCATARAAGYVAPLAVIPAPRREDLDRFRTVLHNFNYVDAAADGDGHATPRAALTHALNTFTQTPRNPTL